VPLLAKEVFPHYTGFFVEKWCQWIARGKHPCFCLGIFVHALAYSTGSAGSFPRIFGVGCTSQYFAHLGANGQNSECDFAGEGAYILPD
jgi:hypothetical protein